MSVLVIAEHDGKNILMSTHAVITAAVQLNAGDIDLFLIGDDEV